MQFLYKRHTLSGTGNECIPVKEQWQGSAAGKVTVGLALQWSCVTDYVVYPSIRAQWPKEGRWTPCVPAYTPLRSMIPFSGHTWRQCYTSANEDM